MSRSVVLSAILFALAFSSLVYADVVPPGRRTSGRVSVPVIIRRGAIRGEANNVQAKIVIPRYLLDGALDSYRDAKVKPSAKDEVPPLDKEAPANPVEPRSGGAAPAGATPAPAPSAPPKSEARATPPWGTVVAGLAMSLAAVSVVFVVRGNRAAKTTALVLLGSGVVLGAYAIGRADIPAPGRRQNNPEIVIQLVDDANEVTLLLKQ